MTYNSYTTCDGPTCNWQFSGQSYVPDGWVTISEYLGGSTKKTLHFCSYGCIASWLGKHHTVMLETPETRKAEQRTLVGRIVRLLS